MRKLFTTAAFCILLAAPILAADPPQAYVPQTGKERWEAYSQKAFLSPGIYASSLAGAGLQVWRGKPEEWELGASGFGKRAGAILALKETQTGLYHASAALLGQDTRFELCDCSGTWPRLKFALSQPFVTRDNSGRRVIRTSYLGGQIAGGMIARSWYPDNYRPWGVGMAISASGLGFDAGMQVLREFKPEIRRLLRLK